MSIYKRGKRYQANFMLDGVRYRQTFQTEEQARKWENETRLRASMGSPTTVHLQWTIQDLVEYVDKEDWHFYRSGHIQARKAHVFAQAVGPGKGAHEVLRASIIETFLSSQEREHNLAPATVNMYAAAISKVCRHALQLGIIKNKPRIKRRRGAKVRSDFFSRSQEEDLCSMVRGYGHPEVADLYVWLSNTGMRLQEASGLVWSDIDIQRRLVTIPDRINKSDKTRTIGLSKAALQSLRDRDPDLPGPWSWMEYRQLRTLWERLRTDLDWMTSDHVMHTFRHTCASRLVQQGVDLYKVKAWLGHASITQTERYAKFAPENFRDMTDVLDDFEDVA